MQIVQGSDDVFKDLDIEYTVVGKIMVNNRGDVYNPTLNNNPYISNTIDLYVKTKDIESMKLKLADCGYPGRRD